MGTALQWLELLGTNRAGIDAVLRDKYCTEAELWRKFWRMFFLATAESFGPSNGSCWGVGYYWLTPS